MKSPRSVEPKLCEALHGGAQEAVVPMSITIMGSGYVGLVSAVCLASLGHRVVGYDIDAGRVATLAQGHAGIHERGLEALMAAQIDAGRLHFTSDVTLALPGADIVMIAVGTPAREDGSADLAPLDAAVRSVSEHLRAPAVVVIKSTVPVGTNQRVQAVLAAACGAGEVAAHVISCPEFLREGSAVADFMRPDHLIVGDDAPPGPARARLMRALAPFVAPGVRLVEMDSRSAELSKCAANAMLAVRVSFMNEIAGIAAETGADIEQVRVGIGADSRIGPDYLRAGAGYGGSCLEKDVAALRCMARRHNVRSDILLAAERVNRRQHCWAFEALRRDAGGRRPLRGMHVTLWGLAFKPGTDDMRGAPSLTLVERLVAAGVRLTLHDPVAMDNARACLAGLKSLRWADDLAQSLVGASALVLMTEWPQYIDFDPAHLPAGLDCVYDGRNVLDPAAWRRAGVRLEQVGRPGPKPARAAPAPAPDHVTTGPAGLVLLASTHPRNRHERSTT